MPAAKAVAVVRFHLPHRFHLADTRANSAAAAESISVHGSLRRCPSHDLAVDPPPLAFVVPLPVSVASPSSNLHDTAIVLSLMRLHRLLSVVPPIESPADRSPSPLRLLIAIHGHGRARRAATKLGQRAAFLRDTILSLSTVSDKKKEKYHAFALHALLCAVVDILSAYCNGQRRWNLHTIFQAREERGLYNCHTFAYLCKNSSSQLKTWFQGLRDNLESYWILEVQMKGNIPLDEYTA
uniref:Uncharacterized protein n=1 Tax=Oryza punctata TaxID=4537 RepID=A0A0E0KWZ5_ORYPU